MTVANSEDKIERRRTGLGELVPALRAQTLGGKFDLIDQFEGGGVHCALGVAPGRKGTEATLALAV